jgi:hypothetical protein
MYQARTRHHVLHVLLLSAALAAVTLPPVLAQQYGGWLTLAHLAWGVNSDTEDMNPILSRDGLSLYFTRRLRPAGGVAADYNYVAHRWNVESQWELPVVLGQLGEYFVVSADGHRAYFSRKTPEGTSDLFVSRRRDQNDDAGWGAPVDLGPAINTPANEYFASLYEDEQTGETFLYFTSDRLGNDDFYVSEVREDGTYGDPVPVAELNSGAIDRQLHIRRDGLECVFTSNRPGSMPNQAGSPSYDIWMATRASVLDAWSTPVNMGTPINSGRHEGGPSYSFDGSQLYLHAAMREGNFDSRDVTGVGCLYSPTCYFDIWVVTREKSTGSR